MRTEYIETTATYFRGIDICMNWLKSFFVVNGILLAIAGALLKDYDDDFNNSNNLYILYVIPILGIAGSISLVYFVPYLNR